jgi:hypothetical protein
MSFSSADSLFSVVRISGIRTSVGGAVSVVRSSLGYVRYQECQQAGWALAQAWRGDVLLPQQQKEAVQPGLKATVLPALQEALPWACLIWLPG